jgi:hypothetical protein
MLCARVWNHRRPQTPRDLVRSIVMARTDLVARYGSQLPSSLWTRHTCMHTSHEPRLGVVHHGARSGPGCDWR